MTNKKKNNIFLIGLKVWAILLLASIVLLPVSLGRLFLLSFGFPVFLIGIIVSVIITFFVFGFLFVKFKRWIFR